MKNKPGDKISLTQILLFGIIICGLIYLSSILIFGINRTPFGPACNPSVSKKQDRWKPTSIIHDPNYIPVTHFDEITLKRNNIWIGGHVNYTITINGNGQVDYHAEAYNDGAKIPDASASFRICEDRITELVTAINEAEYSSISKYDFSKGVTIPGSFGTSIRIGFKKYYINHARGNFSNEVQQVTKFENDIDAIVNSGPVNVNYPLPLKMPH